MRANLRLALETSEFDIVHVYDPARLSISYHALLLTDALTVATFHSPDRVGHPAGKKRRERLLTRVDVLSATSHRALEAARQRFPGQYELLPLGISAVAPPAQAPRARAAAARGRVAPGGARADPARPALAGSPCPIGTSACCGYAR